MTPDLCRRVLALLFSSAGAEMPRAWEPFLALASAAGPIPRTGPLTHDLHLPGARRAIGLNVFWRKGIDIGLAARAFAASWSDARAAWTVDALLDLPAVRWSGGPAWVAGEPRLKLYATGDLNALSSYLQKPPPAGALAVGVDVVSSGPVRYRTYHPHRDALWEGFPAPPALPSGIAGLAHRRTTVLGKAGEDGAKRTWNAIFEPDASISALTQLAGDAVDSGLIRRVGALVEPAGFVVRPVAFEVDCYADGRQGTDALIGIGAP